MKNDIGRMWEVANDPKATSLDRWNTMCSYRRRAGGILLPPPRELIWSYYQSPWVEARLRQALERMERERFTRETGIELVDKVSLAEAARSEEGLR